MEDIDYRAARGLEKTVMRAPGKRLGLGPQPREHFRVGSDRRGQELYRVGLGPESLSRRVLGSLFASCRVAT